MNSSQQASAVGLQALVERIGQPIVAPAAGKVVEAADGVVDNVPGESNPKQPAGNHVILDFGHDEYGLFSHSS